MKKISVITPTYKPKEYIEDYFQALNRQTMSFSEFEVILVLNGEQEPYLGYIQDLVANLSPGFPLQLITTKIAGVSSARNMGLDIACGEYICFIDDDDYISDSYLEELYNLSQPNIIALSNAIAFFDDQNIQENYRISRVYKTYQGQIKLPFYKAKKYFSGPCMKSIHRKVIGDRRFEPSFSIGEDSLFMFLISDQFQYVSFTSPTAVYYRRIRHNSASMRSRAFRKKVCNGLSIICAESKIVLKNPRSYNYYFFTTRIIAAIKAVLFG